MTLIIVTPSYAMDFNAFERLHKSVIRCCDDTVRHIAIVPDKDREIFESLQSGRLETIAESDVLPEHFLRTPWLARIPRIPRGYRVSALNTRHPWPPVRSWILQQILKLAVVSQLDADVIMHIDSDVLLVRPLSESNFRRDKAIRLYRNPHGINPTMQRHLSWQKTAAELLIPPYREEDSPDYIASFGSWSPTLVRDCLDRVEWACEKRWLDAVSTRLEFSEFILYGTYASTIASPLATFSSNRSLCHSYWTQKPMDQSRAEAFLSSLSADEIAIHIQSNSGTTEEVLRWVERAASTIA